MVPLLVAGHMLLLLVAGHVLFRALRYVRRVVLRYAGAGRRGIARASVLRERGRGHK